MNRIGKMTKFKKFMLFFLIAIMGLNSYVVAEEKQKSERWKIDVNTLLEKGKFEEAYNFIMQPDMPDNPLVYQLRGLLLGSGVLSSGKDLCAAVLNLEKAYVSYKFLQKDLNFLYGGDWASVAAMEGNRDALLAVGERLLFANENSSSFFLFDKKIAVKQSYNYIYNAAELGLEDAKKLLATIKRHNAEMDFSPYEKKISFREIYCPVRGVVEE